MMKVILLAIAAAAVKITNSEEPHSLAQGIEFPPAWHGVQKAGEWPLGKVDRGTNDEDVIVHPKDYV